MKGLKAKSPLIIYIAETKHGDISYPAITEKIIKECDSKDLKIKVFSEFGNKEKGWGSEDERCKAGYITADQINGFLNERCVPMGNLFERFTKLIPDVLKDLPEDITPAQFLEQRRGDVDNPETLKLLEVEIALRKENEKKSSEVGSGNAAGKDGEDFKSFWGNGNAFVQKSAHRAMAQDVIHGVSGDEDVILMIAGAPHIYGLNNELGSQFRDCQKLVVGNFQEMQVDLTNIESIHRAQSSSGKESCKAVGNVVGFEVRDDNKVVVPDIITKAISKKIGKETFIEKIYANKSEKQEKSWIEKMRSDPTKGRSLV